MTSATKHLTFVQEDASLSLESGDRSVEPSDELLEYIGFDASQIRLMRTESADVQWVVYDSYLATLMSGGDTDNIYTGGF